MECIFAKQCEAYLCICSGLCIVKTDLWIVTVSTQALSPVGRCKTFEASADGYGRAEGVATLMLCRQQLAQLQHPRTSETPSVIVQGSSVNQGGRSSGLTAPSGPAQTALVRTALASGSLSTSQLCMLSVHGTGTPLGDPIEVGALSLAMSGTSSGGIAAVTLLSNKSCFGHTEGTAGITGLLLSVAALHKQAAPEVMHLCNLNPYVAAALGDWLRTRQRAALNAGVRAL